MSRSSASNSSDQEIGALADVHFVRTRNSLDEAEIYATTSRSYIGESRRTIDTWKMFIQHAAIDLGTAEECCTESEKIIRKLKTEIHERMPELHVISRSMEQDPSTTPPPLKAVQTLISLDEADIYISTSRNYIEASKKKMDYLKKFVSHAEVNLDTAEECSEETKDRICKLKTELQLLMDKCGYKSGNITLINIPDDSSESSTRSMENAIVPGQVQNTIKKYALQKNMNLSNYELVLEKYGDLVFVIMNPKENNVDSDAAISSNFQPMEALSGGLTAHANEEGIVAGCRSKYTRFRNNDGGRLSPLSYADDQLDSVFSMKSCVPRGNLNIGTDETAYEPLLDETADLSEIENRVQFDNSFTTSQSSGVESLPCSINDTQLRVSVTSNKYSNEFNEKVRYSSESNEKETISSKKYTNSHEEPANAMKPLILPQFSGTSKAKELSGCKKISHVPSANGEYLPVIELTEQSPICKFKYDGLFSNYPGKRLQMSQSKKQCEIPNKTRGDLFTSENNVASFSGEEKSNVSSQFPSGSDMRLENFTESSLDSSLMEGLNLPNSHNFKNISDAGRRFNSRSDESCSRPKRSSGTFSIHSSIPFSELSGLNKVSHNELENTARREQVVRPTSRNDSVVGNRTPFMTVNQAQTDNDKVPAKMIEGSAINKINQLARTNLLHKTALTDCRSEKPSASSDSSLKLNRPSTESSQTSHISAP